ncbi:DNA repair protein RadC [Gracilinema caldarium]|uniref:RadC family protein n=1 Tax=Gracilinema caldarium TaxID=215591 RepID=UPI0026EC7B5B|nr:DNA repair protein RadC [Gracilinema caldarium]
MDAQFCYDHFFKAETYSPRDLPKEQRPRERLSALGASALSDRELLAIVLGSGVRGKNVYQVADNLLDLLNLSKELPSWEDLAALQGLGFSKACQVLAMMEFGRRHWGPVRSRIHQPEDAYKLLRHYADRKQEHFICLSLNGAHELLASRIITIGLVNRTLIHPREVFSDPLIDRACAILVAHNHPSGQVTPSPEDEEITRRLKSIADLVGITLLDHIIFSETEYYSFSAEQANILS